MSLAREFRNLRSLGDSSEMGRRVEAKNSDLVRTAVTTTRLVRISRRRADAVTLLWQFVGLAASSFALARANGSPGPRWGGIYRLAELLKVR